MKKTESKKTIRCAIYTRKSTDEGLEQEFNSLDAQREAAEAYIASQRHEGWLCLPEHFDDGGFSGGNLERPALRSLMARIEAGEVDAVVVYKVDRLSRSLLDFTRIMEVLDKRGVSFVSVTQQFNTTNSMGRLTLNILLSFAQFEREIISERTRDKMSAARKKGKWIGGKPFLGYDIAPEGRSLIVNEVEAERVRAIFQLYLEIQSLSLTVEKLNRRGWTMKRWTTQKGKQAGESAARPPCPLLRSRRLCCRKSPGSAMTQPCRTKSFGSMKPSGRQNGRAHWKPSVSSTPRLLALPTESRKRLPPRMPILWPRSISAKQITNPLSSGWASNWRTSRKQRFMPTVFAKHWMPSMRRGTP